MYLPNVNGWEFCDRYSDRPGKHVPIVATSVEQIDIQPIVGIKEFVRKPFYQNNFLQAIQRSLPEN
jgi:CheY-like chemotaxis protein